MGEKRSSAGRHKDVFTTLIDLSALFVAFVPGEFKVVQRVIDRRRVCLLENKVTAYNSTSLIA